MTEKPPDEGGEAEGERGEDGGVKRGSETAINTPLQVKKEVSTKTHEDLTKTYNDIIEEIDRCA
jgi:hypothetical protein